MTGEQLILLLHLFVCVAYLLLGLPLALERVAPNPWYGFRTPLTVSTLAIWYRVNRITGWWMIATGLITLPIALACFAMQLSAGLAATITLTPICAGTLGMIVHGLVLQRRLASSVREDA
ncbi:MAG: SdpI family protein [Rubripirellula sp.]